VLAGVRQLTLVTLPTTLAAPLRKEVQCRQSGFVLQVAQGLSPASIWNGGVPWITIMSVPEQGELR
jgi:hypothetical protein